MQRRLISLGAVGLVLAFSVPAMADVDVYAEIDKTKTVTVTEDITITKDITVNVTVDRDLDKAAEAEAIVNQENLLNEACENCAEKRDQITGNAFREDAGVINVNQSVGNMNNQGNEVSLSVDVDEEPPEEEPAPGEYVGALTHSQAAVEQDNGINHVCLENILFREDEISGAAFAGTDGIINANQAAGNMNNQANAESIAVGFEAAVALSEADLGQANIANDVTEGGVFGVFKSDLITDAAFVTISGIAGVNQAAGNMNNQANTLSLASDVASY